MNYLRNMLAKRIVSIAKQGERNAHALARDALDCDAGEREIIRKMAVVDGKVNEIAQPMRRDFHVRSF